MGERPWAEVTANGPRVSVGGDANVPELTAAMAAHNCEHTETTEWHAVERRGLVWHVPELQ